MVFCYKVVTDRPTTVTMGHSSRLSRRSDRDVSQPDQLPTVHHAQWGSPKKLSFSEFFSQRSAAASARSASCSPTRSFAKDSSHKSRSMSYVLPTTDYDKTTFGVLLNEIPEKDWKILSVLAQKRDRNEENSRIAEQCQQLWWEEQKLRQQLDAAIADEYRTYIHQKRLKEREAIELRRLEKQAEEKYFQENLQSFIRKKEKRNQEIMDQNNDMKATYLLARMLNDELRFMKVAERRGRQLLAEELQKKLELSEMEKRVEEARRRREAMVKEQAQRTAITNTAAQRAAAMLLREAATQHMEQRANIASRLALNEAKCAQLARARELRALRARRLAQFTEQLRDIVRYS